jgi:hypothetical protein
MEPFPIERLRTDLAALAAKGIYIGTSSWKYEGCLQRPIGIERRDLQNSIDRPLAEDLIFHDQADRRTTPGFPDLLTVPKMAPKADLGSKRDVVDQVALKPMPHQVGRGWLGLFVGEARHGIGGGYQWDDANVEALFMKKR